MVPLTKNKDALIEAFRKAGPLYNSKPILVGSLHEDLFELIVSINEVHAVQFWQTQGFGILPFPKLYSKTEERMLTDEIIEAFGGKFPGWAASTKHRFVEFRQRNRWEEKHFDRLYMIEELNDPLEIMSEALSMALDMMTSSPKQLSVVCGPISSGNKSVKENISIFIRTVFKIAQQGPVFNQLPFEPSFAKAHRLIEGDAKYCPDGSSSKFFIDHFYEKIFRLPGMEWTANFIHEYQYSTGAMLEHRIFSELGANIVELPKGFEKGFFLH